MDIIQEYLALYASGFAVGVVLSGIPVMMGSAIGFVYKIAGRG